MIRLSLRSKILLLVFAASITILLIGDISNITAKSLVSISRTKDAQNWVDIILDGITKSMAGMEQKVKNVLEQANTIPGLAAIILDRNTAAAQSLGRKLISKYHLTLLTITDKNGIVIGRGHSDQSGDDNTQSESIQQALGGVTAWGVENSAVVKFAFRGAAPVIYNGEIIGALAVGVNLVTDNHDFVDNFKKRFGVDCTLFNGNTRVSTTVTDIKGKRAIGTTIDNQEILQTVLSNGQTYYGKNILFDTEYLVAYAPLKNSAGKSTGMLFSGAKLGKLSHSSAWSIHNIMLITGIVSLLLFLGDLMSQYIARRRRRNNAGSENTNADED